ncbi:hypothetical protein GCM10027161_07930 [Microbispora hainanensis]
MFRDRKWDGPHCQEWGTCIAAGNVLSRKPESYRLGTSTSGPGAWVTDSSSGIRFVPVPGLG